MNRTISGGLPEGLSREQIQRYVERREQDLRMIESALAAKDARPIREIAHKVKGNAALYGLSEFGLAAGRLLAETERGDWDAMAQAAREMGEKLKVGMAELL